VTTEAWDPDAVAFAPSRAAADPGSRAAAADRAAVAPAPPSPAPGSGGPAPATGSAARVSLQVAVVVGLVGAVLTSALTWTSWTLDRRNEHNLVRVQTKQAAAVLRAEILGLSNPLSAALRIQLATDGNAEHFDKSLRALTGPDKVFVRTAVVDYDGDELRVVRSLGATEEMAPARLQLFLMRALNSKTFVVDSTLPDRIGRVAYAVADPDDPRYVVYAERAIPPNRLVPVENSPAFSNLDFATYLGRESTRAALATTDMPLEQLPLSGDTATEHIPFGDRELTLVARASTHLGGEFGWQLPWILLASGSALTLVTAVTTARFVRRGMDAERDARTITGLYARLDRLYGEQRSIAETLQHALLPHTNPEIPGLRIASRYVAGARGVDIGGDWYSVIGVDDERFGFVVGDVSGRGVSAATVMARLRFTMRAYLLEGHPPEAVLAMSNRQLDLAEDGHFATVLVGVANRTTREVVLANAGHPEPLVVADGAARYVTTEVGPPLGVVDEIRYTATTITMTPGSLLLAFTDGLVERREESIDDGLRRLADAATADAPSLEDYVTGVVGTLTNHASEDDLAVLALRWD
jgi:Stage II sporulation protein E (SpoIIE)